MIPNEQVAILISSILDTSSCTENNSDNFDDEISKTHIALTSEIPLNDDTDARNPSYDVEGLVASVEGSGSSS